MLISMTNIYLAICGFECALRAGRQSPLRVMIPLPSRAASLILTAVVGLLLVFLFGNAYHEFGVLKYACDSCGLVDRTEAYYFSAVTITTLGYGDILPSNSSGRNIVLYQLFSGYLFIVVIVSIVISRVTQNH